MRTWILAALLPLLSAAALAGTPLPDAPHVVVQGEGLVSIAPDSVMVTMVARQRLADGGEAKRVVDRAVSALLELAPSFDVAADDMSASDLSLHEEVEFDSDDRRLPPAYVASREVKVRLGDLERLGAWIDAALAAGFTDVGEVSFKSTEETRLREEARTHAVTDARDKARSLAEAFGGGLGPVYSINSLNSMQAQGYGNTMLDSIAVTGSRLDKGRYLQPRIDFTERVSAVFEVQR